MNYPFYYFAIFPIFANLYLKIINANPPKNESDKSDGQSVNSSAEQMDKVLKKREYTDVEFLFGKKDGKTEIVSAHRAILSSASDVFEAMFRYDEQNLKNSIGKDHATKKDPILVTDIEIGAFEAMLTFIYTKRFNGLDANNWLDVLKAADKYNINGLVKKCANFCANVPIQKLANVFVAFKQALSLNMEDFAHRCLRYIDQNISDLIKSESFLQIQQNLLYVILESEQLRIREIEIWNAALHWADEKCRQKGIECSAENRREMLGSALFNIRFPIIPKEEFSKSVVSTGVLTTEEVISIYQHYSHPNLSDAPGLFPLKFPTHQRYKNEGTIEMEIEKVSEFVVEEVGSERLSDAVDIGGFSWKIMAQINMKNNEKWLCFYLNNNGLENEIWFCKTSITFRIVSQKSETRDLIGRMDDRIFNKEKPTIGFSYFISFSELLDASKGFYNKEEDKVKLAIDVIVDEPKAEKIISDPNKSNGTLSMEIKKLSEFAREIILSERNSESVYIKGMPWKILAEIKKKNESTDNEKWLGIGLLCDASEDDGNWSRECSATFRIVSQKSDVGDFKKEFNEIVFNNKEKSWGFGNFISFAELMDPSKGLYNKDEDKVTLAIKFMCE